VQAYGEADIAKPGHGIGHVPVLLG
jgi:hypothetical protein